MLIFFDYSISHFGYLGRTMKKKKENENFETIISLQLHFVLLIFFVKLANYADRQTDRQNAYTNLKIITVIESNKSETL